MFSFDSEHPAEPTAGAADMLALASLLPEASVRDDIELALQLIAENKSA